MTVYAATVVNGEFYW